MKSKPLTLLFILTILAVLLPPTSTSANTSYKSLSVTSSSLPPIPKVELLSQFGGAVNTIAVQGDYAYAGIAKRLVVFDISDPAHPTLAAQTEPGTQIIRDIAIKGNYAYVVDEGSGTQNPTTGTFDWEGGLHIIDISDPAQPVAVKTYTISWYPHCIQIIGDYAYVTTNSALHIFYLNNPTDLVLKGKLNTYVTDSQVVVQDTTAYITNPSYDALYIVDVSNPVTPTKISTYSMSNAGVVAVQGDYVHLAKGGMYATEVQIIDVSDPANPTSAGSYDIGSPEYLYTESPQGITLQGNYAYVAGKVYGVHIVDISDPTAPVVVASPKIDGGANTVQLAGDHAYTAGNGGGLWVLDVSAPTAPTLNGAYHQLGGAGNITLNGQYAYSASGGLNIIDISDPIQPQETAYRSESGGKIVISNDHAYQIVSSQVDPPGSHVRISDISAPSNPQEIGQLDMAGYPRRNLAADGNFVYVGIAFSSNTGEVRIVDVSDPTAPQERGSFPTSTAYSFGYPNDLAIRDDILYVCQPGFHILDVSDPDNPVEIAHDLSIPQPKYITLAGDYAYIATGTSGYYTGLWILDISDPAHPTTIGSSVIDYYWLNPYGITVSGNYVFIATENLGLKIFDISNPAQPAQVLIALSQYGHELCDVAAQGEYVYLADAEQGLIILRVTPDINAIYGHIWHQNNNFIGHPVQIAVGDSITTTTDAVDSYVVYDLPAGNYTVTPLTPGYIWVPKSHTATLPRSQPESLDFTAYNFYKEVNTGDIPVPQDGDILTYTLSLVYPRVPSADKLYDPIPDQTTYLANSLSAPSGITYDPTLDAIIGTVPLTPNLTTQVSYAVRIVVTNTTGLLQTPITNQACLHYYEEIPPSSCYDLSNEVTVGTWAVYLPLVLR